MDTSLFFRASRLESDSPAEALKLYDELDDQNKEFIPAALVTGLLGPPIAAVVAFFITRNVPVYQTWIATGILMLGYFPIFRVAESAYIKRGIRKPDPMARSMYYSIMPVFVLMNDALILAVVFLLSAISWFVLLLPVSLVQFLRSGPPFPFPWTLPFALGRAVMAVCLVFWLLFMLADLPPRFFITEPLGNLLAEIPVGIRLRWKDILQFFAGLILGGLLAGTGALGIIYTHLWEAVVISGASGIMMAAAVSIMPRDLLLDHLIQLGRARCLIRMGRWPEARWRLERVIFAPAAHRPVQLGVVASQVHTMASPRAWEGDLDDIPRYIAAASDVHNTKLEPYDNLWHDIITRSRELHAFRTG